MSAASPNFKIISVGWNCPEVVEQTLRSVEMQTYPHWQMHIVDDGSDDTRQLDIIENWCNARSPLKWSYTFHRDNRGAVRNQYEGVRTMNPEDEDIIIFLDLDGDQLAHPDVLTHLVEYYSDDTLCTYGSYRPQPDPGGPVPVSPYPEEVVANNSYRRDTQLSGTRYNHLRTAKWKCLKEIPESYFRFPDGEWLFSPTDLVVMMGVLEVAGGRYKCIDETLLLYNAEQPHPDHTRNHEKNVRGSNYTFDLPPLPPLASKEVLIPKWDPTVTSYERCDQIRELANQHPHIRNFVETGSADGDTCWALQDLFDNVYTIEIVPSVFKNTKKRLATFPHIECFLGDSTDILPGLLEKINGACLFWLDGHYCGSLEARGPKDTPVEDELRIIFATGLPHVVLIDDARLFGSDPAYPTVEWVRNFVTSREIPYDFSYVDDVMRAIPR